MNPLAVELLLAPRSPGTAELPLGILLDGLVVVEPARLLVVITFSEIEDVSIDAPAVRTPGLLGAAPVPLRLAVFDARVVLRVHGGQSVAPSLARATGPVWTQPRFRGPAR